MNREKLISYVVMESATAPTKPKNVQVYDKSGLFYVTFDTCLQEFNVGNRNGRIYELNAMKQSMAAPHLIELMNKKTWMGEAGHPMSKDPERILTIDPKLTSHKINSVDFRGNLLYGNVSTLDDGMHGTAMTKKILQGMEPAFSLRALASITQTPDGRKIVKSKCHIVTYDAVILPSHNKAYRDESKPIQTISKTFDGNSTLQPTTESGIMIPVSESSIKNFIQLESTNVKTISNICEVAMDSMELTKDLKYAIMREGSETYLVKIEDRIKHDVRSFMSKF